jgi:hypothetical protein
MLPDQEIVAARSWLADAAAAVSPTASLPPETQALVERAHILLADQALNQEARARLTGLLADIQAAHLAGDIAQLESLTDSLLDILFDYE